MEDFGDFAGQQIENKSSQLASQLISHLSSEIIARIRYSGGSSIHESVSKANDNAERMRDAYTNGPNASYNFDDGVAQIEQFDLRNVSESPENWSQILDSLRNTLAKNGLDPAGLTAIPDERYKVQPMWAYTYTDQQAVQMERVVRSYIPNALNDVRLTKEHKIDKSQCWSLSGFGALSEHERLDFFAVLKKEFESAGLDANLITATYHDDGRLAGDVTVPYEHKGIIEEACNKFKAKHPESTVAVSYMVAPAGTYGKYDDVYQRGVEYSRHLIQKNVGHQVVITQSGTIQVEGSRENANAVADALNELDAIEEEVAYRTEGVKTNIADKIKGGPVSAKDLIEHAKQAKQALSTGAGARELEREFSRTKEDAGRFATEDAGRFDTLVRHISTPK